jgi:hypothetical protein
MKTWQLVEGQGYRFLDVPEPTPAVVPVVTPSVYRPNNYRRIESKVFTAFWTLVGLAVVATIGLGLIELAIFIW